MSATAYPPMARLMPHGPPMRAIEALLDWAAGRATCRVTIREGMPLVRDGRVASLVTLEYMAQAVAVCLGYEAFLGGEGVRVGMVIGVRKMQLSVPFVAVGTELRITVERSRGNDEVSTFEGTTWAGEVVVSTAMMTLFHGTPPGMANPADLRPPGP